jgi:hypothetical protein
MFCVDILITLQHLVFFYKILHASVSVQPILEFNNANHTILSIVNFHNILINSKINIFFR